MESTHLALKLHQHLHARFEHRVHDDNQQHRALRQRLLGESAN
jgi:hypothetical protein